MTAIRHYLHVATPEHHPESASRTSAHLRNVVRVSRVRVKSLLGHARRLMRVLHNTSKKLMKIGSQAIKHPAKGIFPPIGLIAVIALTVATVGIPTPGAAKKLWPIYIFAVVAAIIGYLLWSIPRNKYSAIFASTFGWLPVTLGALSYGFWYWYATGQDSPEAEFFHAAADVLPVLLLAAVVDVRRTKELQSKQLVLPIIAVFLGETSALNALAFGNAGPSDFAAVASSLVSTIVALVLAVMADLAPPPSTRMRRHLRGPHPLSRRGPKRTTRPKEPTKSPSSEPTRSGQRRPPEP